MWMHHVSFDAVELPRPALVVFMHATLMTLFLIGLMLGVVVLWRVWALLGVRITLVRQQLQVQTA